MTQRLTLSIPEPCSESWDAMQPREQGRFCAACAKEVIDFTEMSEEDLLQFFLRQKGQPVCGRLRKEQQGVHLIYVDERLFSMRLPFWKKMLAIILVCFGSLLFEPATAQVVQAKQQTETVKKQKQKKLFKKKKKKRSPKTFIFINYPDFRETVATMGLIGHEIIPETSAWRFPVPGTIVIEPPASLKRKEPLPEPHKEPEEPAIPVLFKNESLITLQSLKRK